MSNQSTLHLADLKNETRVLRATVIMLERVARSDFERLRHYLTGLDSRLRALEGIARSELGSELSTLDATPTVRETHPPH
ncbi:MAG: hypothetical protein ACREDZ_17540 [Kiloniellales bacterium]